MFGKGGHLMEPYAARLNRTSSVRLGEMVFSFSQAALFDQSGIQVRLRPQSLRVLQLLAENCLKVVSKETLIETVWPNLFVSDDSLTQCISDIRKALGDRDRRILRTVPKQGYVLHATATFDVLNVPSVKAEALNPLVHGPQAMLLFAPQSQGQGSDWGDRLFAHLNRIAGQYPAGIVQAAGGANVHFASVEKAVDFALHVLDELNQFYDSDFSLKIGICLANEANGSINERLQDIYSVPSEEAGGSIILSSLAREHLRPTIYYDLEDLGLNKGAVGDDFRRSFRIVDRQSPSLSQPYNDQDVFAKIAVLPFISRMGENDHGMIGELLADGIVSELSPSHELRVISRLSTSSLQIHESDHSAIASYLNVNFIVSGSYAVSGLSVRFYIELSDTTNQTVLWSQQYDVDITEITQGGSMVEELSARIRRSISVHETKRSLRIPLKSLQNYTLLISAINLMHRLSESDFLRARDILRELETRCPYHPEPLAWIGRWHVLRVQQGWSKDLKEESALALSYTARALEIDPDSSLSLSSEGAVLVNLSHDLSEAEYRYSAALNSNPNDAYARLLRGMLYAFQGKGKAAQADCELSLRLTPIDPHRFLYLSLAASANFAAGDFERSMELADASYRLNRSHASTLRILAVAKLRLGLRSEAQETARELMIQQPELRVQDWVKSSPSSQYEIGKNFADALRELGVPH